MKRNPLAKKQTLKFVQQRNSSKQQRAHKPLLLLSNLANDVDAVKSHQKQFTPFAVNSVALRDRKSVV